VFTARYGLGLYNHFNLGVLTVNILYVFYFLMKVRPCLTKGLMLVNEKGDIVLAVCGLISSGDSHFVSPPQRHPLVCHSSADRIRNVT
jgi:hypothetical protein